MDSIPRANPTDPRGSELKHEVAEAIEHTRHIEVLHEQLSGKLPQLRHDLTLMRQNLSGDPSYRPWLKNVSSRLGATRALSDVLTTSLEFIDDTLKSLQIHAVEQDDSREGPVLLFRTFQEARRARRMALETARAAQKSVAEAAERLAATAEGEVDEAREALQEAEAEAQLAEHAYTVAKDHLHALLSAHRVSGAGEVS